MRLNLFADRADQLAATPEQIEPHRNLVQQAYRLFGSQHFDHYDFLLALTDRMGGIGLEHHRSSENGVDSIYFTDWSRAASERDLLAHELVHSWNGKFRRPADLWTPSFDTPMRGSLLWVYEGLTQYYGFVLAARSGLWSQDEHARGARDDGGDVSAPRRPRVALRRRYDERPDSFGAQARAVAKLAAQRGLLLRGTARVARRGHVDSRAHERPPLARRFRARVLRHARRLARHP